MRELTRRLGRIEAAAGKLETKISPPAEPVTAGDIEAFHRFRERVAAEAAADPKVQAQSDHQAAAAFERFRRLAMLRAR